MTRLVPRHLPKLLGIVAIGVCCFVLLASPAFCSTLVTIEDQPVPLAGSTVRMPTTGASQVGNASVTIDTSNTSEGYVMVKYTGSSGKVRLQIARSGGATYTYVLAPGGFSTFPLTAGNGSYSINVFENVSGSQYALAYGTSVSATLSSATAPFLYPSQYVNYNANSATVQKGAALASGAADKLTVVSNVYNYVISNIKYDDYKASTVTSGYLPNVDSILASGKGICFDYAAVMATMLRTQNIPTQLQVGYVSGGIYHAWISVYLSEVGWVNNLIYFDGKSWKMMDPTFASNANQSSDIMKFIGNGSNYSAMYVY